MTPLRRYPVLTLGVILFIAGCGQSSCGCGEQPLAEDLPEAEKVYDGVIAQVSADGFDFIRNNFDGIVNQFVPGGLTFDIPAGGSCGQKCGTSVLGVCVDYDCTNPGQYVCNGNSPCPITANLDNIGLSTVAPDKIQFSGQLDVSGTIPVRICQDAALLCIRQTCDVQLTVVDKPIAADIILGIDPFMRTLTFSMENLDVALSGNDVQFNGNWVCDLLDVQFIKDLIATLANALIGDLLDQQVNSAIDDATCMACDYFTNGCETGITDPGGAVCDANADRCMDPNGGRCVRQPMGMVGTFDVGSMLGSMGSGPAPVDMFIAPGQQQPPTSDPYIASNGAGLDLRLIAGTNAVPSDCVPDAKTLPSTDAPPRIDFATEAGGSTYMVGVGVSDRFLDKALYDVYRSGGLCLNLSASTIDLLTTGLFQTFLPSLGSLTEGRNAPLIIALRPKDRPQVTIGEGTFTQDANGNNVIDDPLLTLTMPGTRLEFYAFVEERFVRLFTLEMDIELPLALEFTANNEIVPIMGDLGSLITNINALNSEILAEDPAVLADLIPSLIGLIEPMLAGALGPIALPDIQGFGLTVTKIAGMVPTTPPGAYEHMGLLADLQLTGTPAPATAETLAEVISVGVPDIAELVSVGGEPRPLPEVVIDVDSFDGRRNSPGTEWQYRIDDGFWSPFQTGNSLYLQSAKFLLQGKHNIDLRSRTIGEYRTLDPSPVRVTAIIDWEPPTGRLSIDHETGEASVFARDLVSDTPDLEYAYSVDDGNFTGWMKEPIYVLPRDYGKVAVLIRDEAGNEKELAWTSPRYIHGRPPAATSGGGCACESTRSNAGVFWALVLLALAAAFRPRPERIRIHRRRR